MPNINLQYKPSGKESAERISEIERYLFSLTERISYCFAHLDEENVSSGILTDTDRKQYESELKALQNELAALIGKLSKVAYSGSYNDLTDKPVHIDTTAGWNSQKNLIGEKSHIYIYSDYASYQSGEETICIPNIKIGDGNAFLIDNPFITKSTEILLESHIADNVKHVTDKERSFWNNKVRCYIDGTNSKNLIFTTE